MKSLLIIGGTGFFGKSILKYFAESIKLNKKFNKIIIFSRKKLKERNLLKKLKFNYQIVEINSDILSVQSLPFADYVIYAAVLKNYDQDHQAVKNYCYLAKKYHLRSHILYASSGAVYGKQKNQTKSFSENYLNYYKRNNFGNNYKKKYSSIKLKNEKLFKQLTKSKLRISIARCFSFVGEFLPRKSNFVIGNIIQNILDKKDIILKADYKVIRSFMFSDDLVSWLLKILYSANTNCPIFNVGSDDTISIHKLAELLGKKYRLTVRKQSKLLNIIIDKYVPSILKAKKKLNLKINFKSFNSVVKTIELIKRSK